MNPIKYGIWAAVSSKSQAEDDKYSLEDQESLCREVATGKGWVESVSAYVVPGKSRTRWINLSDAEQAIPQLKQMLDDAEVGKFDILVVLEYDRFRDLLEPVANALSDFGVQIYSVSQPIDPQDPAEYNPYSSDSEFMMRGMNQIVSKAAIASLRRKYQAQMPLRILNRGLPHAIPYGYRKPIGEYKNARGAVPEQDPELIPYLHQMKDWLLAGHSLKQIASDLDAAGAPRPGIYAGKISKKWSPATISDILRNPFYAGYVRWGRSRVKRNRRGGTVTRIMQKDPTKMVQARGRHIAIWDDATFEAVQAEINRRTPQFRGYITSHLSSLLHCPLCGGLLWRAIRAEKAINREKYIIWRCSIGGAKHFLVRDLDAIQGVASHLRQVLNAEVSPAETDAAQTGKLDDLKAQRRRIADGYQAGIYDLADATERTAAIDAQIKKIMDAEKTRNAISAEAAARAEIIAVIRAMDNEIYETLSNMDPQEANRMLSMLFVSLTISATGEIIASIPRAS